MVGFVSFHRRDCLKISKVFYRRIGILSVSWRLGTEEFRRESIRELTGNNLAEVWSFEAIAFLGRLLWLSGNMVRDVWRKRFERVGGQRWVWVCWSRLDCFEHIGAEGFGGWLVLLCKEILERLLASLVEFRASLPRRRIEEIKSQILRRAIRLKGIERIFLGFVC